MGAAMVSLSNSYTAGMILPEHEKCLFAAGRRRSFPARSPSPDCRLQSWNALPRSAQVDPFVRCLHRHPRCRPDPPALPPRLGRRLRVVLFHSPPPSTHPHSDTTVRTVAATATWPVSAASSTSRGPTTRYGCPRPLVLLSYNLFSPPG